jgi:hypothetical protein
MASQPYFNVALHPSPVEEVHATEGSHSHGLYLLLIRAEGNLQNLNGVIIITIPISSPVFSHARKKRVP